MAIKYRELCKNWGISPEAYKDDFLWLMQDPLDKNGMMTRELGMKEQGGTPIRLQRVNNIGLALLSATYEPWKYGFYRLYSGRVSVSMKDISFTKDDKKLIGLI